MDIYLRLGQEFPENRKGIKIIEITKGATETVVGVKIERDINNSFIVQ
jgi:hypothetical protein